MHLNVFGGRGSLHRSPEPLDPYVGVLGSAVRLGGERGEEWKRERGGKGKGREEAGGKKESGGPPMSEVR